MADGTMRSTPDLTEKREEPAIRNDVAREPVKQPEAALASATAMDTPPASEEKQGKVDALHQMVRGLRHNVIKALPNGIVNNSSNILGALHVGTEVMMLKASSASSGPAANAIKRDPITGAGNLLYQTFKGSITGSMPKHSFKEVFGKNPVMGFKRYLTDTDAAAKFEYERVKPGGVANAAYKPGNRWQNRSTLFGLAAWTLSAVIPDQKEDPQEVEEMMELKQRSPLGYLGERVRQAVWVPQWGQHKRQMIGLGVTLSGVCSILGAWRRRDPLTALEMVEKGLAEGQKFTFKKDNSYLMQSLFTLGSGAALLFSIDDERGFSRFGMGMMGRLTFLPTTIAGKFGWEREKGTLTKWTKTGDGEPGRWMYTAATASFQAENMAQGLIGGAEKLDDGTIVDHAAVREEAKLRAQIKVTAQKTGEPIDDKEVEARLKRIHDAKAQNEKPGTKVASIMQHEAAMPQLAQASL